MAARLVSVESRMFRRRQSNASTSEREKKELLQSIRSIVSALVILNGRPASIAFRSADLLLLGRAAGTHLVHHVWIALGAEQDPGDARVSVAGGRVQGRVAKLSVVAWVGSWVGFDWSQVSRWSRVWLERIQLKVCFAIGQPAAS